MEEYLNGNYSASIEQFEKVLLDSERDNLTSQELAMVYCNISAAEFGEFPSPPKPHSHNLDRIRIIS
jgi:hypothetical protein